jgi:hypothetical protein
MELYVFEISYQPITATNELESPTNSINKSNFGNYYMHVDLDFLELVY